MSDMVSNIFQIKNSKSYIDYKNYHKGNIFGITKMSRWELMHSNFIEWALNPSSSHALGFYPMYQFLRALYLIQGSADNTDARKIDRALWYQFFNDDFITDVTVERETSVCTKGKEKGKIDLLIHIFTQGKILPVIIENKVNSKENGENKDQTRVYFDWGEETYKDRSKYYEPLYIYLYPKYNSSKQKSDEYIRMTYQELVDYILEPSMAKCGDIVSIENYKTYLQCLSFQSDNEKGGLTMAISSEEQKILDEFLDENRELICTILKDLDGVDPDVISAVTTRLKDTSKYKFMGDVYGKGRLVLAVVTQYVNDKNVTCFADLLKAFPDKIQGSKGVVRLKSQITKKEDLGIDGIKRYYIKADEIITLPSGEEVLVSDQWGVHNIVDFIDQATQYGYTIDKV